MIYQYRNFSLFFLVVMKWWYIHTATFLNPSFLYWSDDIYIRHLFFIPPCYNEVMIYKYRNFSSSFLVIIKCWYMHTVTFFILPCYNEVMIYTYCNFAQSFLVIMKWWYIHTATFLILPCDNKVMIYTYCNFFHPSLL